MELQLTDTVSRGIAPRQSLSPVQHLLGRIEGNGNFVRDDAGAQGLFENSLTARGQYTDENNGKQTKA
jgi:hypothetical protein